MPVEGKHDSRIGPGWWYACPKIIRNTKNKILNINDDYPASSPRVYESQHAKATKALEGILAYNPAEDYEGWKTFLLVFLCFMTFLLVMICMFPRMEKYFMPDRKEKGKR